MNLRKLTLALAALGLAAVSARAVTLYQDNFDGLATANLAGTTPDITTNSAVWSGATNFKADGTTASNSAIYLPVSFSTNTTYTFTLTFDLTADSGSTAWGAMGFATTNASSTSFNAGSNDTYQTMLVRQNGGTAAFAGIRTNNPYSAATQTGVSIGAGMQMIITIAVGDSVSSSLLSMSVVGSTGTSTSLLTNQAISVSGLTYLAISSNTSSFTLQELLVTSVSNVPEPSSFALLAGCGVLALTVLRRRRCA